MKWILTLCCLLAFAVVGYAGDAKQAPAPAPAPAVKPAPATPAKPADKPAKPKKKGLLAKIFKKDKAK